MNKPIISLIFLIFIGCCSCTQHHIDEGTSVGTRVTLPSTEARLNRVGFLSPEMEQRIAVQGTGARRTTTNTLEVWCMFRNRTDYSQKIQVRTQFLGKDRTTVEKTGVWQKVFLAPNSIETYKQYSLKQNAEFYYIEVKDML